MLCADETIFEENRRPSGGQEFAFLMQTYYRLTASLARVAESVRDAPGAAANEAWSTFDRLNQLLEAHRSLHDWLAEVAGRPPSHAPGLDVYDLCGKIAAAVFRNPNLSCRIAVDHAPMPGVVLQRFGLLLYEISYVLSLDILAPASIRTLASYLQHNDQGWVCILIFRAEERDQARTALLSTICRAADRASLGVSASQRDGCCSVRVTFSRFAPTRAH